MNDFDLQINDREFCNWYNNWKTDGMPSEPNNNAFQIWMGKQIKNELSNTANLLGQNLWYSVCQDDEKILSTDTYKCGVIIKSGNVIDENEDSIIIDGFDGYISKKELSKHVFKSRSSLLFNLHYDGDSIYDGKSLIKCFNLGDFIRE